MESSVQEAFGVASAVLAALGGGVAIVFAFSSWLGKVWAARILEQERLKHAAQLEELKERIELQLHSGRALFDSEFAIYRELWSHANDVRLLATSLRSGLSPSALSEEEQKARFDSMKVRLGEFEHFVESHRPFFTTDVHGALAKLIAHARAENMRTLVGADLAGLELAQNRMEGVIPIIEASSELCELIRRRLFIELAPNYSLKRTNQSLRD